MYKTKIEWCDSTWNPVTGCRHDCEYCYARRIAQRFSGYDPEYSATVTLVENGCFELGKEENKYKRDSTGKKRAAPYPFGFEPTLHRYRLDQPRKWQEPQTVFVCSMADLFGEWVPDEWIRAVFEAAEAAPQHRYIFLTKNPKRYAEYGVPIANNMWYGISITGAADLSLTNKLPASCDTTFLSIEPLLEDLEINSCGFRLVQADWVIIGAQTGNRSDKVVPQKKWITDIVKYCKNIKVPVFMKDSLIPIVGEENMRREFPWEI